MLGTLLALRTRPSVLRTARAAGRALTGRRARFADDVTAGQFLRGNVHTHSKASDGTASTEAMVGWYRDHGYQFLAMTEHNVRLDAVALAAAAAPMILIPGEEVTDTLRRLPLHVNALCATGTVGGDHDFDRADVGLATMFDAIRARGGIPIVNHPNFHWALTADAIARGASGRYLLEVWSGHPNVAPGGDDVHPPAEAIWDELLARGADAFPVAVDDAHGLPDDPAGGDALPGRAWVETFGDEPTPEAICAALGAGHLYASSGPEVSRIVVHEDTFAVAVTDPRATIAFVGERGELLAQAGADATYRLGGGEVLVRARITGGDGRRAWTAAYRVEAR